MKRQHATSPPPPPAKRNLSSLTSTRAVNLRDWAHANCLTDTPSNPNGRHSITPYLHRISGRRRRRGDAQDRRFQGPELDPSPIATRPERSRHDGAHHRLADRGPRRTADDGGDGMTPAETRSWPVSYTHLRAHETDSYLV